MSNLPDLRFSTSRLVGLCGYEPAKVPFIGFDHGTRLYDWASGWACRSPTSAGGDRDQVLCVSGTRGGYVLCYEWARMI